MQSIVWLQNLDPSIREFKIIIKTEWYEEPQKNRMNLPPNKEMCDMSGFKDFFWTLTLEVFESYFSKSTSSDLLKICAQYCR